MKYRARRGSIERREKKDHEVVSLSPRRKGYISSEQQQQQRRSERERERGKFSDWPERYQPRPIRHRATSSSYVCVIYILKSERRIGPVALADLIHRRERKRSLLAAAARSLSLLYIYTQRGRLRMCIIYATSLIAARSGDARRWSS